MHYLYLISVPFVCPLLVAALLPLGRAPLGNTVVSCRISSRPTLISIGLSTRLPLTADVVS